MSTPRDQVKYLWRVHGRCGDLEFLMYSGGSETDLLYKLPRVNGVFESSHNKDQEFYELGSVSKPATYRTCYLSFCRSYCSDAKP